MLKLNCKMVDRIKAFRQEIARELTRNSSKVKYSMGNVSAGCILTAKGVGVKV